MPVIQFDSVSKRFGNQIALRDLSFELPRDKVLGLLGPNGSGKTTTLRLLLNLFIPDAGSIRVLGSAPSRQLSDRIGYLPEERGLYRRMRVLDVLRYYTQLKGKRVDVAEVDAWLERFDIGHYRNHRVDALSKGTAQKVQFVGTILHQPELLILDEPFSGLDPVSRHTLEEVIGQLRRSGVTIILSTHDMNVAEQMCDTFMMLHKGVKVLDADADEIAKTYGERAVKVHINGNHFDGRRIAGVAQCRELGSYHQLSLKRGADPQVVLRELMSQYTLQSFEIAKPSLNDIFMRLARD